MLFRDRAHAAQLLFELLKKIHLTRPVVLGIPRGGVVVAQYLAEALGAELDFIVAKKLRSPWSSELAVGALAEGGRSYLNSLGKKLQKEQPQYLEEEISRQSDEVAQRVGLLRNSAPRLDWSYRTLILTDDGIATGATLLAALEVLKAEQALEVFVAVPVLPKDKIKEIRMHCDKLFYLMAPEKFDAVGQFYECFETVEFEEVKNRLQNQRSLEEKKMKEMN